MGVSLVRVHDPTRYLELSNNLMSRTISAGPVTLPVMSSRPTSKAALAADAWRSIFDFIVLTAGHRNSALARLGLTPNDSRTLLSLDPVVGRTMRSLAEE